MKKDLVFLEVRDRPGYGQTNYKRSLAYKRLGIRPQDVEAAPFFRANLRRIALCAVRGHQFLLPARPLEYLQRSDDPDGRKVLDVYLSVPQSYRRLLPPEAFCHAAGVSPARVLEIIATVAVREGAMASSVVASIRSVRVVEKMADRAVRDDSFKDTVALLKATGFLPTWGWKDCY